MNSNLNDIGTALTQSIASTGVTPMTGPLKLSAGTLGAPSLTFAAELTTGFYNSAAGSTTYVSLGTPTVVFSATGLSTTFLSATGSATITGALSSGAHTVTDATSPLIVINSTNDAIEHTLATFELGSGAGNTHRIRAVGTGANNITTIKQYIGATEVFEFNATTFSFQTNASFSGTNGITFGSTISITSTGYIDITEVAGQGAPAANIARIYAKDFGTVTELYYQDSAGVENVISPPGSVIGRGYGEYTGSTTFSGTIPEDDTIPQVGEGDQIVTATITLQKSTNRVRVRACGWAGFTNSVVPSLTLALFCSTSANALNASNNSNDNDAAATNRVQGTIEVEHAPGSVGPLTYQLRSGANTSYIWNGVPGTGRLFGTCSRVTLILEEIQV
jgi:hypothetical protein